MTAVPSKHADRQSILPGAQSAVAGDQGEGSACGNWRDGIQTGETQRENQEAGRQEGSQPCAGREESGRFGTGRVNRRSKVWG